ncbi:MAG: hypothetical protein ACJASF_001387, partial [Vicingaceae bacterium]
MHGPTFNYEHLTNSWGEGEFYTAGTVVDGEVHYKRTN